MSMIDGLRNVLGINQDPEADSYVDDNEEDDIFPGGGQGGSPAPEEAYPTQETAKQHSNKVVNINATTQLQVVLVKPERFDDAAAIADQLNAKRTVVLNLESTNKEVSRRLIDFLSGVAYANNGQIKRVATSTFIITPYNVDIMAGCQMGIVFAGGHVDAVPQDGAVLQRHVQGDHGHAQLLRLGGQDIGRGIGEDTDHNNTSGLPVKYSIHDDFVKNVGNHYTTI